ncbi:MAG: hypothetical protein JNL70_04900 [Saprospiraceae bacterium]|nr:hypothetical protein [Saprospiraceae bacterium]
MIELKTPNTEPIAANCVHVSAMSRMKINTEGVSSCHQGNPTRPSIEV